MKWSNVKLIFLREFRDQLRDRRTLFTIAVLPLLMYPLLGMTFLQVAQFMKDHETRIWVVGAERTPGDPALFSDGKLSEQFCLGRDAKLLEVAVDGQAFPNEPFDISEWDEQSLAMRSKREIDSGRFDAVVFFPDGFGEKLASFRESLKEKPESTDSSEESKQAAVPEPIVFVNNAIDKSRMAEGRVRDVLNRWREAIVKQNLEVRNVPVAATRPFKLVNSDVAEDVNRRAAVWSKVLPFVVFIWALTGAFYPAVDLCAGEKERGTLETLLSSPAERIEIVWGKLLTIMTFSMATSLLNMLSMGVTGLLIVRQLGTSAESFSQFQIGPPPFLAMGWLVVALVPISALFSASSLAIAAIARSSKEGQYYLMPLLMICMPLMMLTMLPAAELNLGTSLIPVTGMMFLMRMLIEGHHLEAARYAIPVLGITCMCCWFAIRWAVAQFNDESVLFRESERWDIGIWIRHVVRDRGATPTFGQAVLCGVLLLVIQFFATLNAASPNSWGDIVSSALTIQIGLIAAPVLLMTLMLVRSPRKTLMLSMPRTSALPAAVLLAAFLHPCVTLLGKGIQWLYPMSESIEQQLLPIFAAIREQPLLPVILLIAVTPAICEELAFRGFILSGLRHSGRKWTAIFLSSVFFGMAHGLLQQSLAAAMVGMVIGYIAVQTNSILPGVLFHLTHNSLAVLGQRITPDLVAEYPLLRLLGRHAGESHFDYHIIVVVVAGVLSIAMLQWFRRLPYQPYEEERLQDALSHQTLHATAK